MSGGKKVDWYLAEQFSSPGHYDGKILVTFHRVDEKTTGLMLSPALARNLATMLNRWADLTEKQNKTAAEAKTDAGGSR